ncbi:MAG: ABC transporter permease [Bacteroidota bacterium]
MKRFNLEKAITAWRHRLRRNRSFLKEDIDELESHLRDYIDTLLGQNLDPKEAYDQAITRLGSYEELVSEYKKVRYGRSKRKTSTLKAWHWHWAMLKNYLTIAFRNLHRHPFFSSLNILGLAIGLASCLLILLYVAYEKSFDQHHEQADQIYRLNWDYNWNASEGIGSTTPPPLARTIIDEVPEVEVATRIYRASAMVTRYQNTFFSETNIIAADPNFFEVFSFTLLEGDPATALREPGSVILTKETALKYFGDAPALGETIEIGESQDAFGGYYSNTYKVAGVLEDLPPNSHLDFDVLTSMTSFPIVEYFDWSWVWMQVTTYAVIHEPASIPAIEAQLTKLVAQHAPASFQRIGFSYDELMQSGGHWDFVLQPLDDIYLGSQDIGNRLGPLGNGTYLYILLVVALFILIIACINFMNLSTARSMRRAKEVGVRKVLGSARKSLVGLFMTEAVLLTVIAMIVALGLAAVFVVPFSRFAGIHLESSFLTSGTWLLLLIPATLLIGLLTGSYPSLYLSRFTPIAAMKKSKATGKGGNVFRNGLVVFQFAISIALIVCTLLVNKQMRFFEQSDMGFDKEGLLIISNENDRLGDQAATFVDLLEADARIIHATQTTGVPFSDGFQDYYKVETRGDEQFDLTSYMVDNDFIQTLGLDVIQGQGFSEDFTSNQSGVLLNESAVQRFGLDDPIGKTITYPTAGTFEIIGVLKDFNFMSLHESIMPFALFHQDSESYNIPNAYVVARMQMGNVQHTLNEIRKSWETFAPDAPFEYSFLDDGLAAQYWSERQLQTIFFIFSILAILIACIGLVGLAAFAAEKRTREIGIRKTLGATVPGLLTLLVKDFVKWVLVANLVAWPLAGVVMNWWFAGFAYSADMGYAAFIIATGMALFISIVTVGYQASRVAFSNPIQSLRVE